jgi:hypothetical protein
MNRYALRRTGVSITAAVVCALGIGAAGPGVAQADQPAHTRAVETHAVQRQPAHRANAGWYTVQGTDGSLEVKDAAFVSARTIDTLSEGSSVWVVCQVNNGSTDRGDGGYYNWQYSRTWDYIQDPGTGQYGWVYDHFLSTLAQDANGWSPGIDHC